MVPAAATCLMPDSSEGELRTIDRAIASEPPARSCRAICPWDSAASKAKCESSIRSSAARRMDSCMSSNVAKANEMTRCAGRLRITGSVSTVDDRLVKPCGPQLSYVMVARSTAIPERLKYGVTRTAV